MSLLPWRQSPYRHGGCFGGPERETFDPLGSAWVEIAVPASSAPRKVPVEAVEAELRRPALDAVRAIRRSGGDLPHDWRRIEDGAPQDGPEGGVCLNCGLLEQDRAQPCRPIHFEPPPTGDAPSGAELADALAQGNRP